MRGTILIPQINPTLKDEQFLDLFNDISAFSDMVFWSFEKITVRFHLEKFDSCLHRYLQQPDHPRNYSLQLLVRFFTYVQAHTPRYPSGGYNELLVEWIYATPEIFGHTQEMRFQYAVQTWYSVFTNHCKDFSEDHNTLLIMATQFITQPARFTALICYLLANKITIADLIGSQVLQDFFVYYADDLLQEENPIAYFYHTLLSISKQRTQCIPSINQTLIETIDNLLFDAGHTYDVENAGADCILKLVALTQRAPYLATIAMSPSIKKPSHLDISEKQTINYCRCFGLDWIAPALNSELSHHRVDLFLRNAGYYATPGLRAQRLETYNLILSYLVEEALAMDLDQGTTLMGRLAQKLNPMEKCIHLDAYPELLFLLILNPKFSFLSTHFLLQTGAIINDKYWENRIFCALQQAFPVGSSFTNTRLYLLTKLLMLTETTQYPDGGMLFKNEFFRSLNELLVSHISTCTHFEIDINRVNSKSFYPGAQNIAGRSTHNVLLEIFRSIRKLKFNIDDVRKQWLSHPEKFILLSFLLSGHHYLRRFDPKNIVSSFLLLPQWGLQKNVPNFDDWLIKNVHGFSDNKQDQLEVLMLALLHTFDVNKQTLIILYLSQEYGQQDLFDIFLTVDPNFLHQIIDMKNITLLEKMISLPMRTELKTNLFLYILDKMDHREKIRNVAQQENIHCLKIFLKMGQLPEEAEFALLFFIVQHNHRDLVTLCHAENYNVSPSIFSRVFNKMVKLRKFDCLSHFSKYFKTFNLDSTIVSTVYSEIAAKENLDTVHHYFNACHALLPSQAIGDAFLMAVQSNNWIVYALLYEQLQNLESSYPPEREALHYLKKAITAAYPQVHVLKKLLLLKNEDQFETILVDHIKQSIQDGIVDVFLYLKEHLSKHSEREEWEALAKECPHESIRNAAHPPRYLEEPQAGCPTPEYRLTRSISTSSLPTPQDRSRTPSPGFWKTTRNSDPIETHLDSICRQPLSGVP